MKFSCFFLSVAFPSVRNFITHASVNFGLIVFYNRVKNLGIMETFKSKLCYPLANIVQVLSSSKSIKNMQIITSLGAVIIKSLIPPDLNKIKARRLEVQINYTND